MSACRECGEVRAEDGEDYCLACQAEIEESRPSSRLSDTRRTVLLSFLTFIFGFAVGWVARALFLSMVS